MKQTRTTQPAPGWSSTWPARKWLGALILAFSATQTGCGPDSAEEASVANVKTVQQALPNGSNGIAQHLNLSFVLAADSTIVNAVPTQNFGGQTVMAVGALGTETGVIEYRSLLWFDLAMLPRPASPTKARIDVTNSSLSLEMKDVINGTAPMPLTLSTLGLIWAEGTDTGGTTCTFGADWDEGNCAGTATWSGGLTNASTATTFSLNNPPGLKTFTIPTSVIKGYNLTQSFLGWVLRPSNSTYRGTAGFTTREGWFFGQGTSPPQLDIDYSCATGFQNDLTFGPGGCTGDAGQVCFEGGQCASGVCNNGVCMGDNEATCSANSQCISGSCVSGKCVGFRVTTVGADRDTYIQTASEVNRGGANELLNGKMQESTVNTYRPLLSLPLPPTLPAPVVVNGVAKERIVLDDMKIKLNQIVASADSLTVQANLRRIVANWVEGSDVTQTTCTGGATNGKPNCTASTAWPTGAFVTTPVTSAGLTMFRGQKVWTLPTSELTEMRKSTHQGFMIELASPPINTFRNFASTEGTGVWGGPAPTLAVNYHCAAGYSQGGRSCLGDDGSACTADAECGNGSCNDGVCCLKGCADVQCGSICGKSCNKTCPSGGTCQGGFCVDHCKNGIKDLGEANVDCGGSCPATCNCDCVDTECGLTSNCGTSCGTCPAGEQCIVMNLDDKSWGACVPHCNDGIQNADEIAIDCGGSCGPCLGSCTCTGKACGADDGCGNMCMDGSCPAATRPAAASLRVANEDTYFQAQKDTLGTVNGKWIGVTGNVAALADDGDAIGCGSVATSRDAYYHFRLCTGTNLTIDTEGSTWDTVIGVFPGNAVTFDTNHVILCDADSGTGNNSQIQRYFPAGDYYVVVRSNTTATTGTFNLYIRDDIAMVPTCGGAGHKGQCGVFDECSEPPQVAGSLSISSSPPADPPKYVATTPSVEQEGTTLQTPLKFTNTTATQTDLLFDGFEQGLSRWTITGQVAQNGGAAQNDTATGRVSNTGVKISGTASMVIKVDRYDFQDLVLRYSRATAGLDAGERLNVEWSMNGVTWMTPTLETVTGAAAMAVSTKTFRVAASPRKAGDPDDPATRFVWLRFSLNASDPATEFAVMDNIELSASASGNGGNNHSAVAARGGTGALTWQVCDVNGTPLSATLASAALNPPAGTDICPAIPGPCNCPADPTSVLPATSCNNDQDCNAGESCAMVPVAYCSSLSVPCTEDTSHAGFLATKYCAKPYQNCGPAPALGCFSGSTQKTSSTTPAVTYNQCNNPAEEPCKVVYECPPPSNAGNSGTANPALPAPTPAPLPKPANALRVRMDKYQPNDAQVDACHHEMRTKDNNNNGAITKNDTACGTFSGKIGSTSLPSDIYGFSSCDTFSKDSPINGIATPSSSKFDIDFLPKVFKDVKVKDLPLGEVDLRVHGGVNWSLRPKVWGHAFTLIGVDAQAAIDRCEQDVHVDVTILDQDVDAMDLSKLVDGVLSDTATFPVVTSDTDITNCRSGLGLPFSQQEFLAKFAPGCSPTFTKNCVDSVLSGKTQQQLTDMAQNIDSNGLVVLANRAKKALVDARRVLDYWNQLGPGATQVDSTICFNANNYLKPGRVTGTGCGLNVVNAYIAEYLAAVTALQEKFGTLLPTVGLVGDLAPNPKGGFNLVHERVPYEVLAVSFAFPVGPLSALLEVSAGGYWGVGGSLDYEFNRNQIHSAGVTTTPVPIASVNAALTPEAGAWAEVFVGVGVGNSFIGAYVGVQGELELVGVSLPVTARAALQRQKTTDTRLQDDPDAASDWFGPWNPGVALPQPRLNDTHHEWQVSGNLQASGDLHALDGRIDLAARIKFLFYTLQFSKTIAKWNGFHRTIPLVTANGDITLPDPFKPMGVFSPDVPFPSLGLLVRSPGLVDGPGFADQHIGTTFNGSPTTLGWLGECQDHNAPNPP